jgi:hypothetical protein
MCVRSRSRTSHVSNLLLSDLLVAVPFLLFVVVVSCFSHFNFILYSFV